MGLRIVAGTMLKVQLVQNTATSFMDGWENQKQGQVA